MRLLIRCLLFCAVAVSLLLPVSLSAHTSTQKPLSSTEKEKSEGKKLDNSEEKKPNESSVGKPLDTGKNERTDKLPSGDTGKQLTTTALDKLKKSLDNSRFDSKRIALPEKMRFAERERYNSSRIMKSQPLARAESIPRQPDVERPTIKMPPLPKDYDLTDPGPELPEMVTINGGAFDMGSETGHNDEAPVHSITLATYQISKFEITNRQFRVFVNETGYETLAQYEEREFSWEDYASAGREKYPVVVVSWEDAMEYCKWLSSRTGHTYRLPTEAEWEYAARGGARSKVFPWGENIDIYRANYAVDNSRSSYKEPVLEFIRPVGTYKPNGYGLYDVIGNVWEWCYDWYAEGYYRNSPPENPIGPIVGDYRVRRGGSWGNPSDLCRVTLRQYVPPVFKSPNLGFRVVRVIQNDNSKK
ncbi:MAG: formylglycine-generating enzyme family protein [Acidobacteriota bacterium]